MSTDPQIKVIEQRISDLISAEPELFLVEVKIKPTNNIKVYIDGDQGVSIEKLVNYNRKLYKRIEEEGMYPNGDFSLEVSSPGLDEPLKMYRQYKKNIGRFAEIIDNEGQRKEGKLVGIGDNEIILEETRGKGKKQEMVTHTIPFEHIKSTKILIKF